MAFQRKGFDTVLHYCRAGTAGGLNGRVLDNVDGMVSSGRMYLSSAPVQSPGDSWSCALEKAVTRYWKEGKGNKHLKGY